MSKPKVCPECRAYMSEDNETHYCDCGYEEFKPMRVKYQEDL